MFFEGFILRVVNQYCCLGDKIAISALQISISCLSLSPGNFQFSIFNFQLPSGIIL